jgi:hypothetical protein
LSVSGADAASSDALASDASTGACPTGQVCQSGACLNDTQREVNCVDGQTNPQNNLQKCFDSLWRYTCTSSQYCGTIDVQFADCSPQGYCRAASEVNPACTQASDCPSGKSCVSNVCVSQ